MSQTNWNDFTPVDSKGARKPAQVEAETNWDDFTPAPEPAGVLRKAGDMGLSVAKGVIGVPEAAVGIADIASGGQVGKFLENEGGAFGFRPKQAKEYLSSLQSDDLQGKQREFKQADGIIDKTKTALSNPSLVANAVAESVPLMGAGAVPARAVLAVAPKVGALAAGAIGEGVAGAGSAAEQVRQETQDGLLTPKQAGLAAASGAATAAFGVAGGKLAQRLGIGDVDTMLAQGAARTAGVQSAKSIPRQVVEGAIAEGWLEELPQSVSEQILQNLSLDKPWHEGVEDAAVMGTLSGMAMGGTAAGVSGFSDRGPQPGDQAPPPPAQPPAPVRGTGPTLALPAPDRGVIRVGGDGTARTPAYQAPGYVGDVTDVEPKVLRATAADFASILDTDNVYSGWSNVQDGSDRATMRDQMDYVGRTYGGKTTPENAAQVAAELSQQFKWFRAASPEQKQSAIDALMASAAPIDPVREAVAAAAEQGGALSGAALTAIDSGATQAMQPALPSIEPRSLSLEEADARDQAAYEQFFANQEADPVVSRYFEDDNDIPDFDAASNVSDEEFLRSLGATDEDIQDAIATARQPAIPQSRPEVNAGAQANEPAGTRQGAGGNQAAQGQVTPRQPDNFTGTPTATMGEQGATARPGPAFGLKDALAQIRAKKQQEAANAKAATSEAAPAATAVSAARPGAVEAAGVARSKLLAGLDQTGATREMVLDARLKDAQDRLAQMAGATGVLPADKASRISEINQEISSLNAVRDQARELDERDRREGSTRSMLQGARQELDAAVRAGAITPEAAQAVASNARSTGNAADASEAIFAAVDSSTTGATSEPTSPQAIQASPQPTQAAAAPAAKPAAESAPAPAPAGASTVRALNNGAPAENPGAQAAPAAGAQAATAAEPEFTTIKTVNGDSVTVRTADLNSDKPRLRQYTKDGKSKAVPAIHRDNLDLTGDKRKTSAKEDADNPFFNVITTKDGSTFASQAAASRELNRLAMGETHEVVAASEVQDGAQGFVIRRKLDAPAQETTHNGARIYPTKVKVGDEVKSMWAVESPDNQRRRTAGERTIGGDSLHDTIEQAKAAAEREAKRDAEQQAAKAEQDAADKERLDAVEARKAANRPKTLMEHRKDAVLSKQVLDSETGNVMTRREWVKNKVAAGLKTSITQEDKIKPMSRMQIFRADNRQQAEHDRKVKEAGKKDVYWLGDFEVTKIEYDYAQELKAQREAAQQAEAAPAASSQQATDDFLPEGWTKSINGYTKRPVYRMEQGGGQPFAVVTQVEGMQYEVQIRHGDKQLTVSNQTGALSEVLAKAEAELTRMTQADSVTHQDPGEKAEAATPGVVTDSLKKAARNEDTKPSEMRKWLVAEIDKELLQAADRLDYDEAVKRMGEKDATSMFTGNGPLGKNSETGYSTFDVPGDGKYKVRNSVRGLLEFRKNVMASPGFKDGGQKQNTKPLEQVDSAINGSGSTVEAIRNFLADGDVEGAIEFAKLKGVEFTPVPPQMKMSADGKGKVKHMPASVKSSVPSVAEGLTRVEAEQLNQYLTAESARKEPAATQDADVQPSPQDFIPAPDGGLDYGEITPEMGKAMRRQAGKIRLQHGVQNSNGTGWGLVHIEANHGKQISGLGFGSVQDFVAHVASSIQQVWQVPGNSQLLLTLKDGRKDVMYIQLEIAKEGDFYRVNSAFPVRQEDYESLKGMKKIWDGSEPTSAVTGQRPAFATAASASPESESSQGSSNARGQDASVPPTVPAPQPDTPKLTPTEAKSLMAWEDLGQKDGVKTHALTFYESQADKDAKRGRMIVARVTKEVDSGNWTVEGTGEKLAVLGMAKKKAEQVGMEKAVADGFVEQAVEAPKSTAKPAAAATNSAPIEDAGEKIGGARKDRWKERGLNLDDLDAMTEAEGAELATKANVWKPDYEALAAQSEPVSAAMTKVIYDRLAAKPKKNTPEGRRQYVQMMRIVRDVLTEAKGPDAVRYAYLEIRNRAGLNTKDPQAKAAARELLFSVYKGRSDPFVLDGGDLMKVKKMVTDGFPAKGDPWKARLTVGRAEGGPGTTERGIELYIERSAEVGTPLTREQILGGFYRVTTKDNKTVAFAPTKADAEAAAATVYERDMKGKKDGKPEPVRPNLDELKRENLPQRIDRDVTSEDFVRDLGFRGVEFGLWSAQDERQRILNMAYDGLMDLAEIMGVPPKAMSLNGTLGMAFGARGGGRFAAHYEPGKLVINMTKIRGGGSMAHEWAHAMDHYFGELDKPDAYTTQARGASGWYSEDQYNGVPRRRMERVGNEWKNVEKMRLDNLRPEMAAAFDEVMRALFQKQITKAEMVRSHELDLERTEALAAKEQDADMKAMYTNMAEKKRQALDELRQDPEDRMYDGRGRSDYASQAQELSGKSENGYWTRPTEMFARAFESWVFDKVTAMGARSDYLVHGVEEDRFAGGGYRGNPYPTGEERARINAAFDKLASTIQTKETDKGVALFSSADSTPPAKPLSLDRVNQLVQEALAGIRGAPPVEVTARPADVGLQVPAGSVGYGVTLRSGDIYVFQSAMGSDLDVFKTVFHELFHRGVRVLVPKGQYVQTMLDLAKGDSRIQQLAIEWKNTEMGQKQKENLREQGYTGAELTGQYEALAIEEALAAVAEEIKAEGRLGSKPKNMTIRFLANWLAKLADLAGMKKLAQGIRNMSYNEAERFVMSAIDRSGEPVQAGRTDNLSAKQAAQAGDQTQTENFRRWFGDSKVVDADGKPLVVYHGTGRDFDAFRDGGGAAGKGAYFSPDARVAGNYAMVNGVSGARVLPVYLSISNPFLLNDDDKVPSRYALERRGHDGIIYTHSWNDGTVSTEYVAFRPEQVKSAIGNNGNFDPANADIRFRSADLASRAGMADLASKARDELNKTFGAPGKLSWWHKTVGTMFNLAERSPAFKRVFDAAQGFVDDVSYYATDAAELAPRLLPKLETWRDIAKRPITAADNAAVAKPVFEGTLDWARDESGKPVRLQTLIDAAEKLTPQQKAQRLLRNNKISEGMLKAWQGLPLDQYEKLVASRYESQMLKAGVVWTPAELKSLFKLTDAQVGLYQEFRAATDRSLDTMARADMLRYGGKDVADLRDMVMDAKDAQDAAQILRDHLQMLARENPDRAGEIGQLSNGMLDRAARVLELQEQGYAPLSRFGQYTVDVVDENGERQYFGLFETARDANLMAIKMRKEFGQDAVTQGTLSNDEFKLLAGITPESLEMFGNMLGLESDGDQAKDQAFQEYLRRTKTNRSAMRRLIHRQGIAGYSEDVGRVLASFIYSNSRQTSAGLHMGELGEAITAIPKQQGELKDAAIQLSEYVKNPQEEAQAVRGLLFAQYLGGSIASAFVNMSQPAAVTFPWLSQFGGAKQAAAELGRAAKNLASRSHRYEADLAAALKHAEEEGTVSPQEVHQLMAQARGSGSLRPGDGTRAGEARAAAGNGLTRLSMAWGKVFGAAEQVNRRMTFIAAFRVAKAQGMANPAAFAKKAVIETQFTYSKANKMKWGRGAVGATAMTFKTYSIAYLELLGRMWSQGGPEGKKAVLLALGMLMLMGGAGGLPFAEDAEDLIDGLAQMAGYNISSKKAKQELLESLFGEAGAGFIERGITGLPGMPLDVSGRLGMGNLIPATGLFKEKTDYTRDVLEVVGPVGDLAKRVASGARSILAGDVGAGLLQMAPAAVRNAAKGADMAATGMYRDDKGYKVLDTSPTEAAIKAIGFQPASVSKVQEANFINQQAKNFYNMQAQEIRAKWAKGIFEKDPALVAEARADLEDWNRRNPDQRIVVSMPAVLKRAREMAKSKDQRIADTAPKAMRQQMREDVERARSSL